MRRSPAYFDNPVAGLWCFKPMNAGLRKRISFSAIRTKHKPSLDMLACVSKQLLYRRGNSQSDFEIEITYLEQLQLICEGKLFKIFTKRVRQLQLHNNNATPGAMADETTRETHNY